MGGCKKTMGDAEFILRGFINKSPGKRAPERKKVAPAKKKCPEGVNREVFELQRDNESEFGKTFGYDIEPKASISFINKTKKTFDTKAERWVKRGFTNSARSDALVLHHWDKESASEDRDYYFTKFNETLFVASYTAEEYEAHFTDASWTKEETDLLIDLCKQFDLRFIVIADKFQQVYPGKTIEELRDRYYTIARKKLELGLEGKKNLESSTPDMHLFKYKFNIEHERKRKEQAEMLFSRSGEEIEEEKRLFTEYKRIEGFMKKQQQDQSRATTIRESISESEHTPRKKRRRNSKFDAVDSDEVTANPVGGRGGRRDRGSGAYVRSSRMQTPLSIGANMMKKVDLALDQFGIPPRPIPTAFISKEYNEARQDIVSYLELQSLCKKKLFELEFYKQQLALVEQEENQMQDSTPGIKNLDSTPASTPTTSNLDTPSSVSTPALDTPQPQ